MNETSRDLAGLPVAAEAVPRLGRFFVLSIGINRYQQWPTLQTAVNGAVDLAELLGRDYGFEHARILTDREATREAITGALARLVDEAEPEDSVVIYFAGHGHIDPRTGTGSWIPVDAVADRTGQAYGASATWLPNSVVKDHLKACRARHVLLISDSCFAGDFLRGHREAPPVIDDAYVRRSFQHRSRLALTAGGLQPVMDLGGLPRQSAFTGFLLQALRENDRPWYLPSELHVRIRSGVSENAPQQPLLGRLQDTGGEAEGEFVFFRRGYASLEMALEENRRRLADAVRLKESQEASRKVQLDEVNRKKSELAEKERQLAELRKQSEALGSPAERASGLDQILALLAEIEQRHEELKRREAELAAARRAEEARLEAERAHRLAEARKHFEAESAKYEKVLASPFADEAMKRTAWQLFHQGQGVTVRDPGTPGRLEWGEEGAREGGLPPSPTPPVPRIPAPAPASAPAPNLGPGSRARKWVVAALMVGLVVWVGNVWLRGFFERRRHQQMVAVPINPAPFQAFTNSQGMPFVYLPPGSFLMGSPPGVGHSDEHPQTQVTFTNGFWMASFEARQCDWTAVMGRNPSQFPGENQPVESVLWEECVEFGRRLTEQTKDKIPPGYEFRLPTEAEWEYACRAGTTNKWSFLGEESALERYGWFEENSSRQTKPVGLKSPNRWALHDMHGGVWEWCLDWYDAYPGGQVMEPRGPVSGANRVQRGGSWSSSAGLCRSALRFKMEPGIRSGDLGFRLVLAPRVAP